MVVLASQVQTPNNILVEHCQTIVVNIVKSFKPSNLPADDALKHGRSGVFPFSQ